MDRLTNDRAELVPRTDGDGPALAFDFPGLAVGVAEYREGPTGCTVLHFPDGAALSVDVRGGSPAYIGDDGGTDAICLAGGSIYGLEAVTGVGAELFARRGYATGWGKLAVASGAIIYDFRPRDNAVYPDKALGRAALRAARPGIFPLGPRGAGCSATVGKGAGPERAEAAGQGGAFRAIGPVRVAVFTVVNAIGAIVDRSGRVVRGHRDPSTGAREDIAAVVESKLAGGGGDGAPPGNTTLTVVVTNQKLAPRSLRQLGRQVHSSMARGIQPFQTVNDGDVLFAATTGEVDGGLDDLTLGVVASELAWDAVLSCFSIQ